MTIEQRKVGSPRVVPWTGKLGSFVNDFTASCDEHFEIHAGESLHKARQNLRIDPRRLMSKLLHVLNVRARINSGMAVRAAFTAQFQYT